MMSKDYRLSGRATRVVLALLLRGERETHTTQEKEFATFVGLSWQSTQEALKELEEAGLMLSISRATLPTSGQTVHHVEAKSVHTTQDTESSPGSSASYARLTQAWDTAFPVEEYPVQRLTKDAARRFLSNGRSVEEVEQAILDAPLQARDRISAPRAYVESVLTARDKKKDQETGGGELITDELRSWTRLVKEAYDKQHAIS